MKAKVRRLGVDIGRVIISASCNDGDDTSFLRADVQGALQTPPHEGVFEILPRLVRHFEGQVWLVSKAREPMQQKTNQWLAHHQFFVRTGIPPEHLRYCLERHEKADHCRELGISHFIDDRLDVLGFLEGVVRRRYLFGPQKPGLVPPRGVTWLRSWRDARISAFL